MKVILTAHGSRGDVYPIIAVAERFLQEGHDVRMLTSHTFCDELNNRKIKGSYLFEDAKVEMQGLEENAASVGNSIKWAQKSVVEEFNILKEIASDADLIISTNNEFSVSSIAEAYKIPAFRVAYIPSIPGRNVPPIIPWQHMPDFFGKPMWGLINKGLDFMALKTVNKEREILGLKPLKSLAAHFMKTFNNLFAFDSMLVPPHKSWPEGAYQYCGYPFEQQKNDIPDYLNEFINAGSAPVYIGFGSVTVKNPGVFTQMVLDAAKISGCRVVISEGWTGLGSEDLPDYAMVAPAVSHDYLFSKMAAVCHHGGAGTTHRAAKAGVPQFIMPVIIDQFFWGDRVALVNAGPLPVIPKKLNAKRLAAVFSDLTSNIVYRENALKLQGNLLQQSGVDAIYQAITGKMSILAA